MATIVHNEEHLRNASDFHMVQDIHDPPAGTVYSQQPNTAYGAQALPSSTVQSLPANGYGQAQALPASTNAHALPAGHTVPHGNYGSQTVPGSVPAQTAVASPAYNSTTVPVATTHTPGATTPVAATHAAAAPLAATQTTTRPAVTTATTQPAVHLPVTVVKAKDTSYGRAKPAKTTYVAPGTTGVATTTATPVTNGAVYTTGQPGVVTAPVATTTTVKPKKKGCCSSQPAVVA